VEIGANTWIGPHCVINGPTCIGQNNKIYQFNSLGDAPQDKKYQGEDTLLVIGDGNTIREFCTFNRGTRQGGGITRIGNKNWIMAYVHIAHDCQVGHEIIMANGASLAGHVLVEDHAVLGGFALVHQFCRIGAYSLCSMGSGIARDVPPFVRVAGNLATPYGLNAEGLKRHGFTPATIAWLRRAYKLIYRRGYTLKQALEQLEAMEKECKEIRRLIDFLQSTTRGIVR
jgi:UDP-N-acetylglucosamine acyltransferase